MKTITLDYETYKKELQDSYDKGRANRTDAYLIKKADELLREATGAGWRYDLKNDIDLWLRDYSQSSK